MSVLHRVLGPEGLLSKSIENFECRDAQMRMAELVESSISNRLPAVVESGTGTGKTMAYLIPAILSGKKTIISTGTKNLQEQIFFKDIPLLSNALDFQMKAVVVKGRRNYLCLDRLANMEDSPEKSRLVRWAKTTEFADQSELDWLNDSTVNWNDVCSSGDTCKGSKCNFKESCFVSKLKERAEESQIVITNHSLFFADVVLRSGEVGKILPDFQVAILDEAHKTEDVASTALGKDVSTYHLAELSERSRWHLTNVFERLEVRGKLTAEMRQMIRPVLLREINNEMEQISNEDNQGKIERLLKDLNFILSPMDDGYLRMYEKRKNDHVVIRAIPLDIAPFLSKHLYKQHKSIIFTSATLSTNNNLDYFRTRVGLPDTTLLGIFPSHFDYVNQTYMFIPQNICSPGDPDFPGQVASQITQLTRVTDGRALVLFTSYRNMSFVYELIKDRIGHVVMKQGEAPRSVLLDRFKKDVNSVLLATSSFWEGVDIPGESLSCVIIDKLPFESHEDPLVAAKIEAILDRGDNPFLEYQLPSAIISLKQGLGRLIRSHKDYGILSVLDNRLISSHYGQMFLDSLPNIPLTSNVLDLVQFMEDKREETR